MKKFALVCVALVLTTRSIWSQDEEVVYRLKEAEPAQLRKQLLTVPESGLNQELAATMYQTIGIQPNRARQPRSRRLVASELRADFGPIFYREFFRVHVNNAKITALPWRSGADCQLHKEAAEALSDVSKKVRDCLQSSAGGEIRPDAQRLETMLVSVTNAAAVPALVQLLQVENEPVRLVLVKLLSKIDGPVASEALALRALFDLSPEVRTNAVEALADRPPQEYQKTLLEGFRYPWPAVGRHAANAVLELTKPNDQRMLTTMVDLLKQPDPRVPFTIEMEKKGKPEKILAVRELVRINHMSNCALCHAPSTSKADLVRGRVPVPGEDPPPLYYAEQTGSLFIRADITFIQQDFSVMQPVAQPGKWPGQQRFDFLTRVRPLMNKELKEIAKQDEKTLDKIPSFSQKKSLLFTLRNLTGKDLGKTYDDWKPILQGQELTKPIIKTPREKLKSIPIIEPKP
jgi:hypothetical protein